MPTKLTEITATYQADRPRCRFPNRDGDGHTVIGTAILYGDQPSDHKFVTVKGPIPEGESLNPHQVYRFYGHWSAYHNPRTGTNENQFHFRTFIRNTPHSRAGVIGYLQKCDGIGPKIAGYLYDKFNSSAVHILRTQPEVAAAAVDRLSVEAATRAALWLDDQKALENCTIELIDLLEGRGFRKSIAKDAVKQWGNRAASIIRRNPYVLARFAGAGFKLCDNLYCELGLPLDAMKRQARCVAHSIRQAMNGGHTWHGASVAEVGLKNAIGGTEVNFDKASRIALRGKLISTLFTNGRSGGLSWDGDTKWVALASKADNERELARMVAEILNA